MPSRPLLFDASWRVAALGGGVAAAALLLMPLAGLGWRLPAGALAGYGVIATLTLTSLAGHAPHCRFGPANAVTLVRAAVMAVLLGILTEGAALAPLGRWCLAGGGAAALLLDGIDGWAARRTGLASRFGARFDMEVDALSVLLLSLLVWRAGQAGAWVLAVGLMRYMFVLAGWLWPELAAPLPPSFRRKAICVVEIVLLLAALAPFLGPGAASCLCLAGLGLLSYSFAADIVALVTVGQRRAPEVTT